MWILVTVCLALSALPLLPPPADSGEFSATRAMTHISEIGRRPHPIGSAENERVRSYLIGTLADSGLSPQTQTVEVMDYFGSPGNTVEVVNVYARLEGTGNGDAVALVAHYDTVPETPGANDNSASVAILLEVAKDLKANEPFKNDMILLFTDGEEPNPRFGSRAFVEENPWFGDVAFAVNLEASGSSGGSILAEGSGPTGWLASVLAESTEYPLAYSFFTEIASLIGGFGTDFDPFRDAGVPGVAFAYLHGSPVYHTERDSIQSVSVRSVQHQGGNTLGLIRSLADANLSPPPDAGDSVFFTVARWIVVRYPTTWAVPTALAALVVFGLAVFRGFRPARAFSGVGAALGAFFAGAVIGALMWMLVATIRTTPLVWESYLYLVALLTVTGGLWWILARRTPPDAALFGVVSVWLLLALIVSVLIPGASYLFTWPALIGALVMLARPYGAIWPTIVVSLVTLAVTVPTIDFIFQMAQPRPGNPDSQLIPIAGLVTAVAILLIALIHSVSKTTNSQLETAAR
jgi:Peptidase family M28